MKVTVTVKPNSKKESLEVNSDGSLTLKVSAPPVDGAANERVIEMLSEHFKHPKRKIELVSGHRSKRKVFKLG